MLRLQLVTTCVQSKNATSNKCVTSSNKCLTSSNKNATRGNVTRISPDSDCSPVDEIEPASNRAHLGIRCQLPIALPGLILRGLGSKPARVVCHCNKEAIALRLEASAFGWRQSHHSTSLNITLYHASPPNGAFSLGINLLQSA